MKTAHSQVTQGFS